MKKYVAGSVLVMLSVFVFAGCDFGGGESKQTTVQEMSINGPLLAQVGDWRIGLEDFETRVQGLKQSGMYEGVDLDSSEVKRQILGELIRLVSLSQEARTRGLAEDENVIQALKDYERTILVQKLVQDVGATITVTDEDIQAFYDANPQQFTKMGTVQIREIAVSSDEAAKDIQKQLLDGADFATLARQRSTSNSKATGGDLGELIIVPDQKGGATAYKVEEGKEPQEVSRFTEYWRTVAGMTLDSDATKVKAEDGTVYLIKMVNVKQPEKLDLTDEMKEQLRKVVMAEKQGKEIEKIAVKAKQETQIVLNEDLL